MKDRIINRVYRKITEYSIQKAYEHAIDEMVKRGFDPTSVKKIGGKIKIEVGKDEKTGYEVDFIEAKNIEELVEKQVQAKSFNERLSLQFRNLMDLDYKGYFIELNTEYKLSNNY